jgi:hypothetical protein
MAEEDDCMPVRSYKSKGQRIYPSSYDSFEALLKGSDKKMEMSLNVWHQRYFPTLLKAFARVLCESSLILKFLLWWNWMGRFSSHNS